jgi:hypothetical protein
MTHAEFREAHPASTGLTPSDCPGELAAGMDLPGDPGGAELTLFRCTGCGHHVILDRTADTVRNDYDGDPGRMLRALAAKMKAR